MDTYDVEFSDDLEPVSLTAPGYRGDGGWGFYYLNLTQALMDLYRGGMEPDEPFDSTLLAVSSPLEGAVVSGETLQVDWSMLGAPAEGVSVMLDGKVMTSLAAGSEVEVSLRGVKPGQHVLTLVAEGATTRYRLSRYELDDPLDNPVPVSVDITFTTS